MAQSDWIFWDTFQLILLAVWLWAWAVGAGCCSGGWLWRYVPTVAVKHWTVPCLFLSLTVRSTVTVHSASAWNCVGSVLFLVLLRRLTSLVSWEGMIIQLPVVCRYTVQLIQSLRKKDREIQHVNVRCLFLFVQCCGIVIMCRQVCAGTVNHPYLICASLKQRHEESS